MKRTLNDITRRFLSGESLLEASKPELSSYIQSLREILSSMKPRTVTETRRLEIAKQHLKEIGRYSRRLTEHVQALEEQIKVLEEGKGN